MRGSRVLNNSLDQFRGTKEENFLFVQVIFQQVHKLPLNTIHTIPSLININGDKKILRQTLTQFYTQQIVL